MQLHDNHNGSPYCLMGPGVPYNNNTYDFPAVKPWLDPVDAEFIGFSVAQLLTVPDLLPTFYRS